MPSYKCFKSIESTNNNN